MASEPNWMCQRQRSHGTCNAFNDAEDTSCGACGEDRPAPVPPASGLSDERLAERVREIVSEMCKGDRWRMCVPAQPDDSDVAIIELLDRYARTRSDAALGAALREALNDVRRGHLLCLFARKRPTGQSAAWTAKISDGRRVPTIETDATKSLAALLSRVPEERTRT